VKEVQIIIILQAQRVSQLFAFSHMLKLRELIMSYKII